MKTIEKSFNSYVYKANSRGTGFIRLPEEEQDFQENDQVEVDIAAEDNVKFYARVRKWGSLGVYVPKKIATENNLCQSTYQIRIRKVEGFSTKLGSDGRIYFPIKRSKQLGLDENKIVEVEGKINGETTTVYKPVHVREKEDTIEFMITFDKELAGEKGLFKIKQVFEPSEEKKNVSQDLKETLKVYRWIITGSKVRVFDGNKVPVKMIKDLDINDISYYLGAYFADGTKKGNSWGICASTFEQANFYKRNHMKIIKNSKLDSELTYTFHTSSRIEKSKLVKTWKEKTGTLVRDVQEIKTETKNARNRNKYGSLYFREHKILVKDIYNRMLSLLLEKIRKDKNRIVGWNFILGVMEGDGAPDATKRGHIGISANEKEANKLIQIFKALDLKNRGYKEEKNKYTLRIGSLEILVNLNFLGDKLFQYYPKRRKRSIERLINTKTAKYLLHKNITLPGWIKSHLEEKGILNKDYDLTTKGESIKENLELLEAESD